MMLSQQIAERRTSYVTTRQIEPIEVIEAWSLCHHLASVIEYVASAGYDDSYYHDLRKAEGYLTREIVRRGDKFNSCHLSLLMTNEYTPMQIANDWGLSNNLAQVIENIRDSMNHKNPVDFLIRALAHLQQETSSLKEVKV